jgi:ABC-type branched-subunit amino acid transport system substrate-binding protein
MQFARLVRRATVTAGTLAVVLALCLSASAGARIATQVRGFDGTTIKVASLGDQSQRGASAVGTQARIARFNDTNELKGVKLQWVGFADDKHDPATALAEVRKLVTQDQIFALVGDVSDYNPEDYLIQQKVPFFGWGLEQAYCATPPSTKLWGFGYNGCQTNPDPSVVIDYAGKVYKYVTGKLGTKHPTDAMITYDNDAGKAIIIQNSTAYKGRGFQVVSAESSVPPPPVGDFAPYAQKLLTADNGKAPQVITCLMGVECYQLYTLVKAQGFQGIFTHALYTDALVKPLAGSTATASNVNWNATGIPALTQMKADIEKQAPGTKLDSRIFAGYASTDMFITTLKKAAKSGKSGINPANIQKIASKQTWQLKGVSGPTVYPVASNRQSPYCTSLFESDGTQWNTVEDYSCSTQTYKYNGASAK